MLENVEIVTGISYLALARYVAASGLAVVISISGFLRLSVDYPLMPLTSGLENMHKVVEITFFVM